MSTACRCNDHLCACFCVPCTKKSTCLLLQVLAACRQLTWLDARSNRLSDIDALACLPQLRAVWLGNNRLQRLWGKDASAGPQGGLFLPHLQHLHLQGNRDLLSVGNHALLACWRLESLHLQATGVDAWQVIRALRCVRRLRVLGLQVPAEYHGQACIAALRVHGALSSREKDKKVSLSIIPCRIRCPTWSN